MSLFTPASIDTNDGVWVMVECPGSRVIGRGSRFGSRGRGSKVVVEGQKSRVESRKY